DDALTQERWSAACRALEDEVGRVLSLREDLLAANVRGVDLLAASLLDDAWLGELLGRLEEMEALRRLLNAILFRLRCGERYDVDALRAAALQHIAERPRDEHMATLLVRLVARQAPQATPLFTCVIAGSAFRSLDRVLAEDGSVVVEAAEDEVVVGDDLRLEREPTNRHDASAVRVVTLSGRWLGYVPRARSAVVGTLLDAGLDVRAAVAAV